jgi:uncharacterized repeat protein (TIGR01451 family)
MKNEHIFRHTSLALGLAGLLLLAWITATHAMAPPPANVATQVWTATADSAQVDFIIILNEQADLSETTALPDREMRLHYVYDRLRETARRTQAPLRAELEARGVTYRAFYIVNAIATRGDRALVKRLAARPDVARIAANPHVHQALPESTPDKLDGAPSALEWGVSQINADAVWTLGYTGTGIVVAGQDTGYDWDHPALIDQYRGWDGITATHDYNWHDAIHSTGSVCGADSPEPCDDNGHGTHTMGTMVGYTGTKQIGVAPGAQWIGCRNMNRGVGTPATYIECFEFFLAPYPIGGNPAEDGDPSKAPHVINNSWVCPPSEGCDWDSLQETVENVRAAGIVVVASAGNQGSSCSTVMYPPALYDAAFSIGATDSNDNIASFSSRGPVTADGSGQRKPDVSAPGVSVRSCLPDGRYGYKSGTSMAGPHVAGAVALLWSSAPCLIGNVDTTEEIIMHTARPRTTTQSCGGDGPNDVPNNVYGWGIVDALAAITAAQPGVDIQAQAPPFVNTLAGTLTYTFHVSNTSYCPLNQVVLTDTLPLSTTFAWASGDYVYADGVVTWTETSLSSHATLTTTIGVTTSHLAPGTLIINHEYGVRSDELPTPISGQPLETIVPWRYILPTVFYNGSLGEQRR